MRLKAGSGKIGINKREFENYFPQLKDRNVIIGPFEAIESAGRWDAQINVCGGGYTGQSGAIRMGVARALVAANTAYEPRLRDAGHLTRDARKVERKKYGHRKARRSFQFSKR